MAGVPLLPAEVLLSKRVQEMALNGEEPPHLYLCRGGDETEEDVPSRLSPIPIVDFSILSSSEPCAEQEVELRKLASALCSWGCFQVTIITLVCFCFCFSFFKNMHIHDISARSEINLDDHKNYSNQTVVSYGRISICARNVIGD